LRKFIYGPGIDEPICLVEVAESNAVYYYHFDGLGSVIALSDVNSVLVERYTYDVFGRPAIRDANGTEIAASAFANPYLFTGRAYDAETGLYYYRARYYDYATGRFLQPDPIRYAKGLNLYTYVENNPLGWIDPFGLSRFWPWTKVDYITWPVHLIFDTGVRIGDAILGTPEALRTGQRVINAPAEISNQRRDEFDAIVDGGPIPSTAGPQGQFKQFHKDITDLSLAVPGTSLSGPLPTSPEDVATDLITGTIQDAALEGAKGEKQCPPREEN
jgi:RHS repeat-associated protein